MNHWIDSNTITPIATALLILLMLAVFDRLMDKLTGHSILGLYYPKPDNNQQTQNLETALADAILAWIIARGPWPQGEPIRIISWHEYEYPLDSQISEPRVRVTAKTRDGQTIEEDYEGSLESFISMLTKTSARR
ncbi:hypothetical protein [Bifidobacterium callitrichidarum]|uniref:Uncharacterized protein n=1 Tax=Bifidobacterium callitrichidarum TaxID=2052941 RepID=A0A2U2N992_9BIFI|nr:hypothetical protein [Bifidobacterium callitrichidarum]PWG65584.1 hypothetical protein DF196_06520 [Bifidobacterium callitrichidarum]